MLFSMTDVNAAESDSVEDGNVTVLPEDNSVQSSGLESTEDAEEETDTNTYQISADYIGFVTVEEVETASNYLNYYVETYNCLPETITVGSYDLTMSQFLKILLDTSIQLDQEDYITPIPFTDMGDAPNPAGQSISGYILKSEYILNAAAILNFMEGYGRSPNYWRTSLGNLRFEGLVLSYANIIDFYREYNELPSNTFIIPCDFMGLVTVDEVEAASVYLKNYVETNNHFPETIPLGAKSLTIAQFFKVLLTAVVQIDQEDYTTLIYVTDLGDVPNSAGHVILGNILKSDYISNAGQLLSFMESYGRAPNYWRTSLGNLCFEGLVLSYANIMDFQESNDRLPNYTVVNFSGAATFDNVKEASLYLKKYVTALKLLPWSIKVGSYTLTLSEFLKVLLISVINSDQNLFTSVVITDVDNPPKPAGQNISGTILKSEYLQNANAILNFIDSNGRAPNYGITSLGDLRFDYIVFGYAKIMDFHKDYNRLPNYAVVKNSDFNFSTINAIYYSAQLRPTNNCQSTSSTIINFAKNLTKNCFTTYDKALAIFEWVRDYCDYTFYYNTKYGAVGMLYRKDGNCIDHSHLINALARSVGIPARYAHAQCKFTNMTVGHIWSELYIRGRWVTADATSLRNDLGTQLNCKILYWKGRYTQLPF